MRLNIKHNPRTEIRSSLKPSFVGVALTGLLLCLANPASAATITITMIENGESISVSTSGSLVFVNPGSDNIGLYSDFIGPANGTIGFGPSTTLTQQWETFSSNFAVQSSAPQQTQTNTLFSPFGSGSFTMNAISGFSGSNLFVFLNGLAVSRDYLSGDALSATGTILGSFATNGITVGTSTTQFTLGSGDALSNTLIVTRSIPEPTTSLLGLLGTALLLRRRRVG